MKVLRPAAVCLLATLSTSNAWAGSPDIRGMLDPVGSANAKIAEARHLLLTQRPLDLTRFAALIGDAHKRAPMLDKAGADVVRRAVTLFFGQENSSQTLGWIDYAVTLNPALAFDDTLQSMCSFFGQRTPAMSKQLEARRIADEKKHPKPKDSKPVIVSYVEAPEDAVRPLNSPICGHCVSTTAPDHWPKILTSASPMDPRGARAPKATVAVTALIDKHGRVAKIEDALGPEELREPAKAAVRQWTFQPMTYLGVSIPTTASLDVTFGKDAERTTPTQSAGTEAAASAGGEQLPKFGEYVYVEELPEAIERVKPTYEGAAKQSGATGTVLVQALVGGDGAVKDTRVTKSVADLNEAAVGAVRQWRFKPALAGGKPVAVWVAIPILFPPK